MSVLPFSPPRSVGSIPKRFPEVNPFRGASRSCAHHRDADAAWLGAEPPPGGRWVAAGSGIPKNTAELFFPRGTPAEYVYSAGAVGRRF